jgi:hypothetical protein
VTAPATLLPAVGAAAAVGAWEYSKGQGASEENVLLAGSAAAVALGAALLIEEQDYISGPLLVLAGAVVGYSLLKR